MDKYPTPPDLISAERELSALRKRMQGGARFFSSFILGLLAASILIFGWGEMRVGVWILVGVVAVLSLGIMFRVIPPGPWPRKYDTENLHDRIAFLEGFIRAAKEKK